jgi:hypothetical protein
MADYIRFWFEGGGSPNSYTFWVATSTWANYQTTGNPGREVTKFCDLPQ